VTPSNSLERRLWDAANQLCINFSLTAQEYSTPLLGLIFLKYADFRFSDVEEKLRQANINGWPTIGKNDYQATGVLYLPDIARYQYLINLPEDHDIGAAINDAMRAIEEDNKELRDILPKTYNAFENTLLFELLKIFNSVPMDLESDYFGIISEYFLGKFAMSAGRAGEFYTPTSVVKLIVDIVEPFHGKIYDPACGLGGIFVQSARFVRAHRGEPRIDISIYGQESTFSTLQLAKLNLAINGLSGKILQGNTYYEDKHNSRGQFDFVMANPPFNITGVDNGHIKDDPRYPFGLPKNDNANYLWIQNFYSALNEKGRAGFVMANSASDAWKSELEIRKKLIQVNVIDVVIAVSSNFFYTFTLPVTLWFLDKGKMDTDRTDKVLFIDARNIYNQLDPVHRDFTPQQTEFLSNIVRLYRGQKIENHHSTKDMVLEQFGDTKYQDVKGLCKISDVSEIEDEGWSLNPARYVTDSD
jgi:type I restriction enzyme M protein